MMKCCNNCYKCKEIRTKNRLKLWFIKKFDLIFCDIDKKLHKKWVKRHNCTWFWPVNSGIDD